MKLNYNKTIIGNSILYLGDCLEVMKIIPDKSIDCVITDPPYSLNYSFENDNLTHNEQFIFMNKYMKEFSRIIKNNGTICIFMEQRLSHYLYFSAIENEFIWQNTIIWNRDGGQMPTKKFGICYEPISIFTKGKEHKTFNLDDLRVKSKYAGTDKRLNIKGKNPGDVWYIPALFGKKIERIVGENGKAAHPTQKPIDIILPLIIAYTNENDLVLDSFMGTNTTGFGCSLLNRKFIGIEKNEKYFEIAKNRRTMDKIQIKNKNIGFDL